MIQRNDALSPTAADQRGDRMVQAIRERTQPTPAEQRDKAEDMIAFLNSQQTRRTERR